ncbi:hypothetical protein M8013_16750 [Enterobacteriaceae bacterium H4N4]|uniref:DUF6708 domain-containing protein n=1 Tax=Silvania confinis TaxID=2926470 RepID=A0A9J6QM66_9ENTR|nr:DUF6708 domain-containing protein [Silvania confinis]MCU6670390.1 hypothetical protein [Silvania confinis]
MDYYGLFPKFKLNRPLNEAEIKYQLNNGDVINCQSIMPDAKVISMNSNFLEMVDKYYSSKGLGSLVAFFGFSSMLFVITLVTFFCFFDSNYISLNDVVFFLIVFIPSCLMAIWMLILLKSEWFAWTHYPVRFDRKNRLVHVSRLNGSTYSVPWDSVFFTSGLNHRKDANKDYYISGHVLADDGETVIDTFCLPATHSDRKQLERHWEFVRRYMEEGPDSVVGVVDFCLPIAKKREGYRFGLLCLLSGFNGAPLFLFPFLFVLAFIFSIPRYLAMVTSRVPVWPESIELQCQVDKDDPYLVDASRNPKHPWRNLFKKPSTHHRESR